MTGPRVERSEQLVVEITVSDLDRSLAQYTALGFTLDRRDGGFAAIRWEDRRLFLAEEKDLPSVDGPSRGNLRIIVPNVDELWRLARDLGMPVERELDDRYYGLRDFTVLDPDGFGLRFASVLPSPSDSENQRFSVEGIDHVAMRVRDVPRSVQWYRDVLGLERRYEAAWGDFPAVVGAGTTSLALFPAPSPEAGQPADSADVSIRHIAFRVDRITFDSARAALAAHGITAKFDDHVAAHSLYFTDPDGHQLEITTYEVG